jgi:hypothetical protein
VGIYIEARTIDGRHFMVTLRSWELTWLTPGVARDMARAGLRSLSNKAKLDETSIKVQELEEHAKCLS